MVRGHVGRLLREHTEEKVRVAVWENLRKHLLVMVAKIDLSDKEERGRHMAGAFVFMCMCVGGKWSFHRKLLGEESLS